MRLDQKLVDLKLAPTKSQAQHLIRDGLVLVNNQICDKPGKNINDFTTVVVSENYKYVSRGAKKLLAAIAEFKPQIQTKICADFGASTGGFTQVLLENGAKLVYAIDVGTDQLNPKIKKDPRVVNLPNQNIKDLVTLPHKIEFATVDLSFISITKVFEKIINLMKKNGKLIILYKPQFEVGQSNLNKKGIADLTIGLEYLQNWLLQIKSDYNLKVEFIKSPILGQDGNQEYLLFVEL